MIEKPTAEAHFRKVTPDGDDRERDVCGHCGLIEYGNPMIVVWSVLSLNGAVLLRRALKVSKSGSSIGARSPG